MVTRGTNATSVAQVRASEVITVDAHAGEIAAEIVENLEAALDRFRKVALSLQSG
jgi:hypothetical protein